MTKIFAINAGSSSMKFQLFEMPEETVITKGLIERIGMDDAIMTIEVNGEKFRKNVQVENHKVAVDLVLKKLIDDKIIADLAEISGVGHRVVHGGEIFPESVLIDDAVIAQIKELSELSPLHNPANITGIEAFKQALPNITMVAVFDTAFHQTMPKKAYLYSIPMEYHQQFGVRKYGFHGTSHQYIANQTAEFLQKPLESLKIISCHLGNGASITAIDGGKSVDTSMGFTPLEGLTMGTRSGSLDLAVVPFLMKKLGKSAEEVIDIFNKKSGMLALSGISSDLRDIEDQAVAGNEQANLALDIFADRIKKAIGMYAAVMHGVDAIVFTAGVGENSPIIRARVMSGFEYLGAEIDQAANANARNNPNPFISTESSKVKVLVIPTNEEVMIARDVVKFM